MSRSRRPAALPELCQPTSAAKPPSGPGWIHEIKYDGYRIMAQRAHGGTRLFTRNGHDWSARYPLVVAAVEALWARSCIIDGELAKCDEHGLPVFDLLRAGPRAKIDVALFAFDLLELNGEDLRREPIEARKARLTKLLRHSDPNVRHPGRPAFQPGADTTGAIQLVDHIEEDASTVFAHACQLGYEGIVSKVRGSRYESGRSSHWLKVKNPNHAAVLRLLEED
jgi:ATP-dependent DNA ligase